MTKLISAFPEWGEYRIIAVADDGTVYTLRLTEDGWAGTWVRLADGIEQYRSYVNTDILTTPK